MEIYISRNQQDYGPYSEAEVREHLRSGDLSPDDFAWRQGLADWVPLHTLGVTPAADLSAPLHPPTPQTIQPTTPPVVEPPSVQPSIQPAQEPAGEPDQPRGLSTKETSTPAALTESPHPGGRHPRGTFRIPLSGLACLILLSLLYAASPYFSLWQLSRALETGNTLGIKSQVDFPALRTSLGEEVQRLSKSPGASTAAMGTDPALANYVLERFANPEGITSLLSNPGNALRESVSGSFASGGPAPIDWSLIRHAWFTSPVHFVVTMEGIRMGFGLTMTGWRLRSLEVQ